MERGRWRCGCQLKCVCEGCWQGLTRICVEARDWEFINQLAGRRSGLCLLACAPPVGLYSASLNLASPLLNPSPTALQS
jgi:hypothetical protein